MNQTAQTWITVREAPRRFRVTRETTLKPLQIGLFPIRTDMAEQLILWDMLEATLCRQPRPLGARAHGR